MLRWKVFFLLEAFEFREGAALAHMTQFDICFYFPLQPNTLSLQVPFRRFRSQNGALQRVLRVLKLKVNSLPNLAGILAKRQFFQIKSNVTRIYWSEQREA